LKFSEKVIKENILLMSAGDLKRGGGGREGQGEIRKKGAKIREKE
jgi:hypothetical protein